MRWLIWAFLVYVLPVEATNLTIQSASYTLSGTTLSYSYKVQNTDGSTSAPLRVEMWAIDSSYSGGVQNGIELANDGGFIGAVGGGRVYNGAMSGPFTAPAAGVRNVVLIIKEGGVPRAWWNFGTRTFADTEPPTIPTNVVATAVSSAAILITWSPSTDNVAVASYKVYYDGTPVGVLPIVSTLATSYTVNGLKANTNYKFRLAACDAAGKCSAQTAIASATTLTALIDVVEYHNASLDHYFITWVPSEVALLDAGDKIMGWVRTGYSFKAYTTPQGGASPVCRYYIPPGLGDSHFFGRGKGECDATGAKNPAFNLEDPAFMETYLPTGGVCPTNTASIFRVFSNRPDANHRYMTDKNVRDQMVARGWLAEGDGPDLIVMCAPSI